MTGFDENHELGKYIDLIKNSDIFAEYCSSFSKGTDRDIDDLEEFFRFFESLDNQTLEKLKESFSDNESIRYLLNERLSGFDPNHSDAKNRLTAETIGDFYFYKYLSGKIEEKGFASDSAFYNYIGMSRQTFGKLKKKNASVSRNHALLMAVGLGLDYKEAVEFLSHAGYTFRPSSIREQIIAHVMKTRKYDLMVMEEILMIFGQEPLTDI